MSLVNAAKQYPYLHVAKCVASQDIVPCRLEAAPESGIVPCGETAALMNSLPIVVTAFCSQQTPL